MAIQSALDQTYTNLEVIVGDDCSSDITSDIVDTFSDKRLRYIRHSSNKGRVKNYHELLYKYARGEWVVNLDGDDYFFDKDFVKKAVELVEEGTVLVFANQYELLEKGKEKVVDKTGIKHFNLNTFAGKDVLLNYHENEVYLNHLSTMYNKQLAIDAGFYKTDILSSDLESFFKILPMGNVKFLDAIAGVWRRHHLSETNNLNIEKRTQNFQLIKNVARFHKEHSYLTNEEVLAWEENMSLYWCRSNLAVCFDLAGYAGFFKMFLKLISLYPVATVKSFLSIKIVYRLMIGKVIPYRSFRKLFKV
jgi:glycosyltransferase involved in cell wall biosynthesis